MKVFLLQIFDVIYSFIHSFWKNKLKNYLWLSHLYVFLNEMKGGFLMSSNGFLAFFQNSFCRSPPQIGIGMTYVVDSVTNKHLNFSKDTLS